VLTEYKVKRTISRLFLLQATTEEVDELRAGESWSWFVSQNTHTGAPSG